MIYKMEHMTPALYIKRVFRENSNFLKCCPILMAVSTFRFVKIQDGRHALMIFSADLIEFA